MRCKMAKIDSLLDELIESQVETLIQDDAYYQLFGFITQMSTSIYVNYIILI